MISADPADGVESRQSACHYNAYMGKPLRLDDRLEETRDGLDLKWVYEPEIASSQSAGVYTRQRTVLSPTCSASYNNDGIVKAVNESEQEHRFNVTYREAEVLL